MKNTQCHFHIKRTALPGFTFGPQSCSRSVGNSNRATI